MTSEVIQAIPSSFILDLFFIMFHANVVLAKLLDAIALSVLTPCFVLRCFIEPFSTGYFVCTWSV